MKNRSKSGFRDARVRRGLVLLEPLHPLSAVDLEVDGAEDDDDADDADEGDGVAVDEAGEQDGHGLPQGADDDEHDGAELGYRVENK